jgi:hypothetical protein
MNDRFMSTWSVTRRRGIKYYMLVEGSIFGFLVFVITGLISLWDITFKEAFFTVDAFYTMLAYILGGIFVYSPAMWWYNERMFKKYSDSSDGYSETDP